ncbi:MAG: NUDIX domain-containing protein [Flavobacteriales bacterium]|jgi:ADP-ribose pyrophosphatase YjhB (NUDIX family)|nr:NUDIX domain-containing protein [Flavobacteriales bacterium]
MKQKYKVFINNRPKLVVDNWGEFCSKYQIIDAAGGVVYNNESLLMIFRNGKWDLPKGKKEMNETDENCAIREVSEECGVSDLKIIRFIKYSYHTYKINSTSILKITAWFLMSSNYNQILTPQKSEGISKVVWVNQDKVAEKLKNTYGNISDVLKEV